MEKDFSMHNIAQRTKRGTRKFHFKYEKTVYGQEEQEVGEK